MQKKAKHLIIIVIVAVTATVIVYVAKQKVYQKQMAQQDQQQSKVSNQQQSQEESQQPKSITTVTIEGTVSKISDDSMEISNGDAKNTFFLMEDITVFSISSGKVAKKTIADIKKGRAVSVVINQANSSVVSVQIMQPGESASGNF